MKNTNTSTNQKYLRCNMATNHYQEKQCPFRVDAAIIADTYNRQNSHNVLKCIGPECMAWKNAGGPDMLNCSRMG